MTPAQRVAAATHYTVHGVGEFTRSINNVAEWSTRLGVYRAFLDRGFDPERAAQLAKELTIDFDRSGTMSKTIGKFFMFINAGVQADAALIRGLAKSKAVRIATAAVMAQGFSQNFLGRMTGGINPLTGNYYIDEVDPSVFEKNMVFMLPGNFAIKIPLPYELAAIHNAGRYTSEAVLGHMSPMAAAGNTIKSFVNNLDPITDTAGGAFMSMVPSLVRPVADVMANNSWNGRQVRPNLDTYGTPRVPSATHYGETSGFFTMLATAMAKATGGDGAYVPSMLEKMTPAFMQPDAMQYLFEQYLGGTASMMNKATAIGQQTLDPVGYKAAGHTSNLSQIPVVGSFIGNGGPAGVIQRYEEMAKPVLEIGKSYMGKVRSGDITGANALVQQYPYVINEAFPLAEATEHARAEARKNIKAAQADPNSSTQTKANLIDSYRAMEQNVVNATESRFRADSMINRNDAWNLKATQPTYQAPVPTAWIAANR
jgi:hypothetical protein